MPAFGNSFIVETPYIDKLSDRLYAEERERKLMRERENQMLDQEFARNLSGIRDADIGELTKAYGDFKLAHQGIMRKKGATPQEQLEVLRKKADIYDILNKSKQEKEYEDNIAKQIPQDKKGIFADNAQQILVERRRTPFSKINRDNDKNLFYQYLVPDLAKELKTARGEERTIPITLGVSKVDPLKDDKEVYEVRNTPNQFYNTLLEQIFTANKGRNFTGVMNNKYSENELEDLYAKYQIKIKDPKFISLYGKVDPFTDITRAQTDLEKAVAIRTMEEFVNLDLKPSKTISELNQDRSRTRSEEFRKKMAAQAQAWKERNIRLNKAMVGNQVDLTDYRDEGESKDITSIMQGFKVTGLPDGKSLLAEKVTYNPRTKEFTVTEFTERDNEGKFVAGGKTKVVPFTKFVQDIKGLNPQADMKFLQGLENPILNKKDKEAAQKSTSYTIKGKTYSHAAVENAAKKSGMTIDEYIKAANK